jgi:hypothetical protein
MRLEAGERAAGQRLARRVVDQIAGIGGPDANAGQLSCSWGGRQ